MVRELNTNKKEHLRSELLLEFPNLTETELKSLDNSFEELINSISFRTQRDRNDVARILENKLDYIHSKNVF
jgi:hypothetical protein